MRVDWTPEEDAELIRLNLETDLNQDEIALAIGRPTRGTAVRWHKLRNQRGLPTRLKYLRGEGRDKAQASISPQAKPIPAEDLFRYLKDQPHTVEELCRKFDCSPDRITERLHSVEVAGWHVKRLGDKVVIPTGERPTADVSIPGTLADKHGMVVPLGIASDLHAGSIWSQPTALRRFTDIATNEYGVREMFNPGDCTMGIYGFRGIESELVPTAVPISRQRSRDASVVQAELYNLYTPQIDGLTHFELGGNHDFWHVGANGFDPVRYICNQRPDMVYLGYTLADIPLTDNVTIRLWHPASGIPYAKSYRLQKGMEAQAYADLKEAVEADASPNVSVVIGGHLHITICVPALPLIGVHPGCFEGRTKFLQAKGLTPDLGGTILRFLLTDSGRIQRLEYTFVPFDEIRDDWKNYGVPDQSPEYDEMRVTMDALYQFEPKPDGEPFPVTLNSGKPDFQEGRPA